MKNFAKKYSFNIFVFVLLFVLFGISNTFVPVENLDELWKYQHAKSIVDGQTPYIDANLITTPFYFYFTSIFLMFHSGLFVFRIYSTIFNSILFFFVYLIIKEKNNKNMSFYITLMSLLILTLCDYRSIYIFDYNRLFLLLTFVIIYMDLKIKNKTNFYYFCVGCLFALLDLTKQSNGVVLVLLVSCCFLLKVIVENKHWKNNNQDIVGERIDECKKNNKDKNKNKNENKNENDNKNRNDNENAKLKNIAFQNKKSVKEFLWFIGGLFILNFLFLINLIKNKSFFAFFDCCLFGMSDFHENSVTLGDFIFDNYIYGILFIFTIIALSLVILSIRRNIKNIRYLLFYVSMGLFIYPICDINHFSLLFLYSVLVVALLYKEVFDETLCEVSKTKNKEQVEQKYKTNLNNKKMNIVLSSSLTIVCIVFYIMTYVGVVISNENYKISTIENFKHLYIKNNIEDILNLINLYIEENYGEDNVLILTSNSTVFSISNDTHNGVFDIFAKGNIGTTSPFEHIEKEMETKSIICISNIYKEEYWQNIDEVYDYVVENYELVDEYCNHLFFAKKIN